MKTFIVLPLYGHISDAEAKELADEVSTQMGLSLDAYVAYGESLPKPVWMEVKA